MNKSIILTVATLLVTTSGLIGVSCEALETPQFVTYTNEAKGFSIDYPEGWEVEPFPEHPKGMVSICTKTLLLKDVCINVYKTEAPLLSLEDFSEVQIQSACDITEDYTLTSREELVINGILAIKHDYNCTRGSTTYFSLEVYLVYDGKGWILSLYAPLEAFDAYESIFDSSLKSFRLL